MAHITHRRRARRSISDALCVIVRMHGNGYEIYGQPTSRAVALARLDELRVTLASPDELYVLRRSHRRPQYMVVEA